MIKVHPYLNFDGKAEEAFNFYKSILGGEFSMLQKMSDLPNAADIPESERNRVMHVALPINDYTILMASDCVPSLGHVLIEGNNMYVSLGVDSREEADRIFNGLSAGGRVEMPMEDMFWGDYFGSFKDQYGVQWMISYAQYQ